MIRFKLIGVLLTIGFLIVWLRLFYWQVLSHERLQEDADSQHFFRLEIPALRGEIRTSDGSTLVTNQTAYLVFAEKNNIKHIDEMVKKLAPILEESEASLSARFASSDMWVPLKSQVEDEKVQKIKELQLGGLGFERDDKRYYPEASMAAHLLGFVGKNELGQHQGYFGLEGYYDKELRGQSGTLRQERDAMGNPIVIGEHERINSKNGHSLVLYLDKTVQFIVEEKLKKALGKYGAKAGNVIVMDPETGGIIASASFPSYDPGHIQDFPGEYYKNPAIADSYEPGSTFKPLIMGAAIDRKKIKATDTFDEDGSVHVANYTIKTWNDEYHGNITMTQILEYSSNVGMVYVGGQLGNQELLSFVKSLGIGESTGVDLQEESYAALRPDDQWREIDYATVSFGQGIAVTPLQMIRAIAAVAKEGVLMEPRAVQFIVSENESKIAIPSKKVRQLVSYTTAKIVTEMMIAAVSQGEAKWAVPKGYRIAGKTGTAQIPVEGHYDSEKTIASFVGFAPADAPRFVMLVTLREPQSSPWGSETAAPLFFDIAKEILPYYGIVPQ